MSIMITATVGSASANSFVTEAEYIARMAARLNVPSGTTVTGTDCTEDEKKALIEAAREFQMLPWIGWVADSTQALSWPRQYAVNPIQPYQIPINAGYYYDTTEIPQLVKDAQIELAMEFLKAGTTDVAARDSTLDVSREKVDVLETDYVPQGQRAQGLARYPRVVALLMPLLDETKMSAMTVSRL